MQKYRSLFRHGEVFLVTLATLLMLAAPARTQDTAKIEIVPMLGHSSSIASVAFSPDGTRVLSGGGGEVKLWDAATGALIRTFEGPSGGVSSVAFSPDGGRILSGSADKTIRLWDAATGALIRTFEGHAGGVGSAAFSPDGTRVLSGSADKTIRLWDAATGALIRTFEGHSDAVESVAFSPEGTRVLSGGEDHTIKLWDTATGALIRTFEGHATMVNAVAFSPDGARVVSGSGKSLSDDDHSVKLWDATTGALIRTFEGRYYGGRKAPPKGNPEGHSSAVNSVAFSPDGSRVLSGSGEPGYKALAQSAAGELSLADTYASDTLEHAKQGAMAACQKHFPGHTCKIVDPPESHDN
jgi:WD40 repeat protein